MDPQKSQAGAPQGAKRVRTVAGYELISRLGEGGTGSVFKARQPGLERFVALKILSPELAKQAEYLQRFRNEAKAAAKINHPNVVQVLAAGFDEAIDIPYIIYELVDGVTLTRLVEERRGLSEREALAVTRSIGEALGKLNEEGLIHRDVKPDNILITKGGIAKLADLGLARQDNDWDTLTATGIVMGTPDYMAPEQAMGKRDLDLATDLYALGLTLYVMLTARLPYHGETLVQILTQHIQVDCPNPQLVTPGISVETAKLVALMTRRDPKMRYNSSEALIRDIDLILAGRPILGPKAPLSKRMVRPMPAPALATAPAPAAARRRRVEADEDSEGDVDHDEAEDLTTSGITNSRRRETSARRRSFQAQYLAAFFLGGVLALLTLGFARLRASQPETPKARRDGS